MGDLARASANDADPTATNEEAPRGSKVRFISVEHEWAHLVRRAQEGSRRELQTLLAKSGPAINSIAWSILGNDSDRNDVVQQVMLAIATNLRTLDEPEKYKGWMRSICVNTIRSELRKRKRWRGVFQPAKPEHQAHAEALDPTQNETTAALYRVLAQLSERHRLAFCLRHVEGFSREELAESLDCTERTAKRLLEQARAKLLKIAANDPVLVEYLGGAA